MSTAATNPPTSAHTAPAKPSRLAQILKFFLFVQALVIFYFILGYLFAEKPIVTGTENKLYYLFDHADYQKPLKTLNANPAVIVTGTKPDGLYLFIDHYLNKKIADGFAIKKRTYEPGVDLEYEKYPYLAVGYDLLQEHVTSKVLTPRQQTFIWVIDTKNALEQADLEALSAFAGEHPSDKIIVATQGAASVKGSGFKHVKVTRPNQNDIRKLLKQQQLSEITVQNILDYCDNDLELIDDLVNTENVQNTFNSIFAEETENINSVLANSTNPKKALNLLNELCTNGVFKTKSEVAYIPKYNPAVAFDKNGYYWTSVKHTYAFSNNYNKDCDNTVQTATPEAPPTPVEEPEAITTPAKEVVVEQTTTETVKATTPEPTPKPAKTAKKGKKQQKKEVVEEEEEEEKEEKVVKQKQVEKPKSQKAERTAAEKAVPSKKASKSKAKGK